MSSARSSIGDVEGSGAVDLVVSLAPDVVREYLSGADLYEAVVRLSESALCDHLRAAAGQKLGLEAKIEGVLEGILWLRGIEPNLLHFLGMAAVEPSRHPGLRHVTGGSWACLDALYRELFGAGVVEGVLDADDVDVMVATITAMTIGLITTGNFAPSAEARAAEGLRRLVHATLVRPPAGATSL